MTSTEAQATSWADLLHAVGHGNQRVIIEHGGKPVAAVISFEDLEDLERLERRAEEAWAASIEREDAERGETGARRPWSEVKVELYATDDDAPATETKEAA
jgi:antitoxin (DNA-binding transcriptional repressor) of toxin-antitoxin stability system